MNDEIKILELKIAVLVISLLCLFFMITIKDLKVQVKDIKNENSKILNYLKSKGE